MIQDIDFLWHSLPILLQGMQMTLSILLLSAPFSLGFGLVFGVLTCSRLQHRFWSPIIDKTTFILRAVPFYVQLMVTYFVLPGIIGYNLHPLSASVLSLGLCSSAYVAQIVRGGMNAVADSQWEEATVLGYNRCQQLLCIVCPQMFRMIIPSLNNELEALLKSTSIVSSIGVLELTRVGMNLVSREMKPMPIYLGIAALYLCLSIGLQCFTRMIERRMIYVRN